MKAADELAKHVGVKPACAALEVSRSTLYRRRGPSTGQQQPRPTPARALSETERGEVFDTLCSERFVDRSPAEVVATLLDEEVYLCSERTMYRVLASEVPVQERRAQRTHPEYKKPELMATAPNQVWSWDITRLLGPKKWSYYYLYVIMDIYSRYVVGWMVADRENSALAGRLIQQSCLKHGVQPRVLTLHSDRGAPMTSQCTAQLLADLGVTRSLSRPQVSDDNPFSEAQFKTLKYHPSFPGRFGDQGQAKTFCRSFFRWYNAEHRHGHLDRTQPGLPLKKGRAGTMTHDYKRHGTTTLFAALDVATGEVVHECLPRHRHQEFLRFLRKIERSVASELDIHVILDNYATHKHPAVRAWLDKHPRVHFHFIPTSSSWLNLVERFFSELTTRRLKRLAVTSVDQLIEAINHYIDRRNDNPTPFVWTASAQSIIAKVSKAKETLATQH